MNGAALFVAPRLTGADLEADMALDRHRAAAIRADRGCTELRRGRPVALTLGSGWLLAAAVETLGEPDMQGVLQAAPEASLLLSTERLQALEWAAADAPQALALPRAVTLQQLQQLAAVRPGPADAGLLGKPAPSHGVDAAWSAALAMCKRSRLIPALLLVTVPPAGGAALDAAQVLKVDPADVALTVPRFVSTALTRVSEARVPLAAEEACRLVLFREVDGDAEHVAIVVGTPPVDAPVPVRLHSSCLTGDLLGSLRCDCGLQLQRAVARLAETGGILLYLAQEGRGTGLANKLRAYELQDDGLDTLQADRHLGFREDERDFAAAAAMLRSLGHTRIQLLTNNPQKIDALRQAGIDVVDRVALHGVLNAHNEGYIRTKQRAGHLGTDD